MLSAAGDLRVSSFPRFQLCLPQFLGNRTTLGEPWRSSHSMERLRLQLRILKLRIHVL